MKKEVKIVVVWIALLLLLRMCLIFPHRDIGWIGLISAGLQLLLGLICLWTALSSQGSQKYVYIHFTILFGFVLILFIVQFVGKAIYSYFWIDKFGLNFVLLFTIFYALVDDLFRSWKLTTKYLISLSVVGAFMLIIFLPYLTNPLNLCNEQEYKQFRQLKANYTNFVNQFRRDPSEADLIQQLPALTTVGSNKSGSSIVTISPETVHDLFPYLLPGGEGSVFWKPIHFRTFYVNVFLLLLIGIFLAMMYRDQKPHSAYIDKLMILFFAFCFLDMFNNYAYIKSVTTETFQAIFTVGQYFSILCLLIMVYAFGLKFRFAYSTTGQYYEKLLQESPERVTRWRDELDTLILKSFFKNNRSSYSNIGQFARADQPNQMKGK
ncbi:MAG: hypothetical protein HYR76_10155 [Ignavibacteria bacterium]|nr:hypothetical protein [Ignavibacteria bacterium]